MKKIEKIDENAQWDKVSQYVMATCLADKINELVDALNSLLQEQKKVEHYIWTGEYSGEGSATYGNLKGRDGRCIHTYWRGNHGYRRCLYCEAQL